MQEQLRAAQEAEARKAQQARQRAAQEAQAREAEQARENEAQERLRAAQEAKARKDELDRQKAEQGRLRAAQDAEEAFEPAMAAFAPISAKRFDPMAQKGAWRALWMFFEPKDAQEARDVLKLPEDASLSEVRSKMAKADASDKHQIQQIERRSSSFQKFEQIGTLFAFTPPTRDSWQAFLSRLDDWGKGLIAKITKLAAPQNVDLKPAKADEAKSTSEGKRDEAPKPYRPSNGPSM